MKKLLATLLVAAMLISCMSIVAFADEAVFETVSSYPYAGMDADNGKTGSRFALLDPGFAYLYEQYEGNGAVAYYDANGNLDGYVPTAGDYIAIPLNITSNSGIGLVKANVAFDSDMFDFITVVSAWEGAFSSDTLSAGNVAAGGMLSSDETETGVTALSYIFQVKSDAVGDSNGDASSTFTFSNARVVYSGGNSESNGTITTPSLTINLTDLTPGAPATKEDITADKMPAAAVATFTADAAADKEWLNTNATNIVSGDDEIVDIDDGKYTAAFGNTANYATYNTPDKFGIALYADGELKGYYEAKKFVEGKFGILFFGLKDGVEYTMKNYVQYGEGAPIVAE